MINPKSIIRLFTIMIERIIEPLATHTTANKKWYNRKKKLFHSENSNQYPLKRALLRGRRKARLMYAMIRNIFETITTIPHCSGCTKELELWLIETLQKSGCDVQHDEAGNIYAKKGRPTVCLQAHYDMVCLGEARPITLIEKDGWLQAQNSTLGADNGVGVAIMMALAQEASSLELLLTNDEEIGLIGAQALAFDIVSPYILNLDSEEEGALYVGCAGGFDAFLTRRYEAQELEDGYVYNVRISNLPGGHSGVDIDKDIPNAILCLADFIEKSGGRLLELEGGERSNSIPKNCIATLWCPSRLDHELWKGCGVTLEEERHLSSVLGYRDDQTILSFLHTYPHGVMRFDPHLGIPSESLNLAMVSFHNGSLSVTISGRSMSFEGLEKLKALTHDQGIRYGLSVTLEGKYDPWPIEENPFITRVQAVMEHFHNDVKRKAIHAGLECAVLKKKYPTVAMASIGPTIERPHSFEERVYWPSVERCYDIVKALLKTL